MPGLSDTGEDIVLNDIYNAGAGFTVAGDPYIALHTADPADTGANEATGGSYARQQTVFGPSASGIVNNTNNIDFVSMPATTIVAWSVWDSLTTGLCYQTGWLSTVSGLAIVRTADATANDVQSQTHGLANDDRVEFEVIEGLTVPAGLTAGTLYFVIATGLTTDAFRVATTSGGAAVDITGNGSAIWRKVTPKVVNSGDTFRIPAASLNIFATE